MPPTRLTPSEEDYLLAISRSDGPVRTSELARALNVADPSVTLMVSKLCAKGLVQRRSHRPISLTEHGSHTVQLLLRRHRLIELFLIKVLGYNWAEVHEEAHSLEHAVSEKFVERLDKFLGHPTQDPHGAPIPTVKGEVAADDRMLLVDLPLRTEAVIAEVRDGDPLLLDYLGELGLFPGAKVVLTAVAPFDGPISIKVNGHTKSIGKQPAAAVWVKPLMDKVKSPKTK